METYITYGMSKDGPKLYKITLYRSEMKYWLVEICPCDANGNVVSDPIEWDIFRTKWSAKKYMKQLYKEYERYVNYAFDEF